MGSWTQYDEDACRLPAGMGRIGYDTDTERYTFQDEQGVIYESEPGDAYGLLKPVVRDASDMCRVRPNAFESSNSPRSRMSWAVNSKLSSFDEFLPPAAVTFTSSSPLSPEQRRPSPPDSRLTGIVLKVKSMKSASVTRLQTSKSEGRPRRHSKSFSLIPSFLKLQLPPPLPGHMSRRSRAYSEAGDKARTDDRDEMKERLLSKISTSSFEPSSPSSSRQPSVRSTSLYQNTSTSHSGRTLPGALRVSSISATSIATPMRAT